MPAILTTAMAEEGEQARQEAGVATQEGVQGGPKVGVGVCAGARVGVGASSTAHQEAVQGRLWPKSRATKLPSVATLLLVSLQIFFAFVLSLGNVVGDR